MRPKNSMPRHALALALAMAFAGPALAQLSTGTVKGQIQQANGSAKPGAQVVAVNQGNGASYRATAAADGSYVLNGLAPGVYQIRVDGQAKTELVTVRVAETSSLDLRVDGQAVQMVLDTVVVTGQASRGNVRDTQVGTHVSNRLIEALPQTTRNFLSSVDLAPGVAFVTDASGNTKVQAGSQNHDNLNVFIDGVGQKNNILRGGLTGQDTSRGNPFPQGAIAEFRVLTQNYKAEFDQVSSAAITAVTKSGTNTLKGEAYFDRTGTNWRKKNPFEQEREAQGVPLPPSTKKEFGVNLGGPIIKDQLHFFFAYDGKEIEDSRQVLPRELDKLPAGQGVVPQIAAVRGSQVDGFKEHLFFGKLDAQLDDSNRLTFSARLRREDDRTPESRDLSAPGNDSERTNDETRVDLKHEWANGDWLSEARVGYEHYRWNPHSAATTPFIKYKVSTATPPLLSASQDVLFIGGSPNMQDRAQRGVFISEDLSYTGFVGHVLKGGIKLKNMEYELSGTAFGVDTVEVLVDRVTGQPYFNGTSCTGTNIINNGANSDQCKITRAIPGAGVNFKNKQLGLYLQDDWQLSRQLELSLGARWDYEDNMLNNDYATPAERVAALRGPDGRTVAGITAPAGQTYAQSLAKGGINIDDYISNGNSRKPYKGALAPRVGASYDLFGDRRSVVFGGWGRSYDRSMANHALDELQKNAQPGGEIWLIRNDFKMPYADQMSIGLRQAVGGWNAEVALSRITAKNQFVWFGGNRDPNGGWGTQSPIDPLWGGPNGFGTLILGDFVGENRTNALLFKLEKPYSQGWMMNVAYTYSDAKTLHKEWNNDIFDWTYGRSNARGWNRSTLVDKHNLVVAGLVELPWELTLSGKAQYASGLPRRTTVCAAGWSQCVNVEGGYETAFKQVDVGLAKAFSVYGDTKLTIRADVLNLFNAKNYGGFDDWGGGPVGAGQPTNQFGGDNLNLGKPNSMRGQMRTYRLMASIKF